MDPLGFGLKPNLFLTVDVDFRLLFNTDNLLPFCFDPLSLIAPVNCKKMSVVKRDNGALTIYLTELRMD